MNEKVQFEDSWRAIRIVHLPYGCRAINEQNRKVVFTPESLKGDPLGFELQKFHDLYTSLRERALQPIGVEYFTHSGQVAGEHPPEWRHYFSNEHEWLCTDLSQKWSWIAYQSNEQEQWHLADLAARIAHQSRVCALRLRQLSDAYAVLLNSCAVAGDFEDDQLFDSEFTWEAYLAIQAYLVDICILRDYFAEFYGGFWQPIEHEVNRTNITKMGSLKNLVLDKVANPDSLTQFLIDSVKEDGWLTRLGGYRDTIIHSAPLSTLSGRLWAKVTSIVLSGGRALPVIKLAIPIDPMQAAKARSKGDYFMNKRKNVLSSACDDPASPDGLMYCYRTHNTMIYLSSRLIRRSPVLPEIPVIRQEDMLQTRESTSA